MRSSWVRRPSVPKIPRGMGALLTQGPTGVHWTNHLWPKRKTDGLGRSGVVAALIPFLAGPMHVRTRKQVSSHQHRLKSRAGLWEDVDRGEGPVSEAFKICQVSRLVRSEVFGLRFPARFTSQTDVEIFLDRDARLYTPALYSKLGPEVIRLDFIEDAQERDYCPGLLRAAVQLPSLRILLISVRPWDIMHGMRQMKPTEPAGRRIAEQVKNSYARIIVTFAWTWSCVDLESDPVTGYVSKRPSKTFVDEIW